MYKNVSVWNYSECLYADKVKTKFNDAKTWNKINRNRINDIKQKKVVNERK